MYEHKLAQLGTAALKAEAEINRLEQEEGWEIVTVFHSGAQLLAYARRPYPGTENGANGKGRNKNKAG